MKFITSKLVPTFFVSTYKRYEPGSRFGTLKEALLAPVWAFQVMDVTETILLLIVVMSVVIIEIYFWFFAAEELAVYCSCFSWSAIVHIIFKIDYLRHLIGEAAKDIYRRRSRIRLHLDLFIVLSCFKPFCHNTRNLAN